MATRNSKKILKKSKISQKISKKSKTKTTAEIDKEKLAARTPDKPVASEQKKIKKRTVKKSARRFQPLPKETFSDFQPTQSVKTIAVREQPPILWRSVTEHVNIEQTIAEDAHKRPRDLSSQLQLSKLSTRLSPIFIQESLSKLRVIPIKFSSALDPRLQLAIANRYMGKKTIQLSSAVANEIPVIARVKDPDAWKTISDVFFGAIIGRLHDDTHIVTGRIPIDRIEAVRSNSTVKSLKASQPVTSTLRKTKDAMRVSKSMLSPPSKQNGGAGVVIGIIDFGGDFAHPNFRDADGKTRLLALWNQSDTATGVGSVPYGRAYTRDQINSALDSQDPYDALRYAPEMASHGTHVMDIAAGNGLGTHVSGLAPLADLVFIEASAGDIPWSGPDTTLYHFGDSVQILEAIKFIFETAGDRPCVVNISLGTNGGPHDGSSLVEQGIDAIIRERPNSAVVIAAGNSQDDCIHTDGQVSDNQPSHIQWQVFGHAGGEFELWYDAPCELEVSLIAPDGTFVMTLLPNSHHALEAGGEIAIFGSNRLHDPNNHSHVISIWLAPGLDGGTWQVQLQSTNGHSAGYHAWLERLDGAQSKFIGATRTHSLGSISTGHESIVVGSYNAHDTAYELSSFSSYGPTRDNRQKPEISAPGQNVMAACSRVPDGVVRMSGTSMAAPAITGLIALMLSEAQSHGKILDSKQIRQQLQHGANPTPAPGGWDRGYGAGLATGRAI